MKNRSWLGLCIAVALLGCQLLPAEQSQAVAAPSTGGMKITFVQDGEARAEIVSAGTTPPLRFAAEELQKYVRLMSGAVLPIRATASDASAEGAISIVISVKDKPQDPAGDPRSADHYCIEVGPKGVRLEGASSRAALFAVYDLLERLGCGWCVPGDDTVPSTKTVVIGPLKIETQPAFKYRMMLDYPMRSIAQSIAIADWLAKNRMNWIHPCANAHGEPKEWYNRRACVVPELKKRGLNLIFGGHTMHTWLPDTYFEKHPDWFALNDGERKPPRLCVTNGAMTTELIRNLQRFLDKCPEVEVVDLWHPDGTAFCHCPVCTRGLVPESARGCPPGNVPPDSIQSAYVIGYIEFMNTVAAAIAKSHPRVMISPLIYGSTDRAAPEQCPRLADNLLPGLAHFSRDSFRPLAGEPVSSHNLRFLGNDLTWMAKSRQHYIYEYYNSWLMPFIYPGARVIVRDLQIMRQLGIQGSSSDMYGYSPTNMYVAARALWSPDMSWEAAVREFNLRYYNEVGEAMADNWLALEKGIYGLAGYQGQCRTGDDALKWPDPPCGQWLKQRRSAQLEFLQTLLAKVTNPLTRVRLERAIKPWKMWSVEARWWAFPDFEPDK